MFFELYHWNNHDRNFLFKLLALTIQHEKPDLEEQKTKLLQQEEDKKIQLAKLEESLLEVKFSYSECFVLYFFL